MAKKTLKILGIKANQLLAVLLIVVVIIGVGILFSSNKKSTDTFDTSTGSFDGVGKLSADAIDDIPDISIDECLSQIKIENPEMSDSDAQDNCYTIEAVNKGDKGLCNKVSDSFKNVCLELF